MPKRTSNGHMALTSFLRPYGQECTLPEPYLMTSVAIEAKGRHRLVKRVLGVALLRQRNQTRRKEFGNAMDSTIINKFMRHAFTLCLKHQGVKKR